MLVQRVLTGVCLILLVLAVLLWLPAAIFEGFALLVLMAAAFEWSFFLRCNHFKQRLIYVIGICALAVASRHLVPSLIAAVAYFWWLIACWLVLTYPFTARLWQRLTILKAIMGVITLSTAYYTIVFIYHCDAKILLSLLAIVWVADSGAYFCGRWWGKHKLLAAVSPGKTWEGVIGGMIVVIPVVVLSLLIAGIPLRHAGWLILFAIIIAAFSIIGDLFESMLKRSSNIKDSGKLLPGHGGILDRIDSLLAAAPIFLLFWLISSHYSLGV